MLLRLLNSGERLVHYQMASFSYLWRALKLARYVFFGLLIFAAANASLMEHVYEFDIESFLANTFTLQDRSALGLILAFAIFSGVFMVDVLMLMTLKNNTKPRSVLQYFTVRHIVTNQRFIFKYGIGSKRIISIPYESIEGVRYTKSRFFNSGALYFKYHHSNVEQVLYHVKNPRNLVKDIQKRLIGGV